MRSSLATTLGSFSAALSLFLSLQASDPFNFTLLIQKTRVSCKALPKGLCSILSGQYSAEIIFAFYFTEKV